MRILKILSPLIIGLAFFLFTACTKDDDPMPELIANAGPPQNAKIDEIVTLDGTGSSGPGDLTYSWTYQGSIPESEINFQNKNSSAPTFVPNKNGNYSFTLTIRSGDNTSTDQTVVIVSGAVEIGGVLTEDLILQNLESDASLPDYIVTSDLVIPGGFSLRIADDDVIIWFMEETGIHIQQDGMFTNSANNQDYTFNSELKGEDGWKGILVDNGGIDLNQTLIINAGKTNFADQAEAAAITFSGSACELISLSDNEFVNSFSYDIAVNEKIPENAGSVAGNKLSYSIPIKAPITFMGFWDKEVPNIMPAVYDYIHLVPSGISEKDEISDGYFYFPHGHKYYIDGDFWAGSKAALYEGSTLYIKENSALFFEGGFTSMSTTDSKNLITGLNGALWKGIAFTGKNSSSLNLWECIIENAGHGNIEFSDLSVPVSATVYSTSISGPRMDGSEIINSGGYGIYHDTETPTNGRVINSVFRNTKQAAIRINLSSIDRIIPDDSNIFDLAEDVPGVLLSETSSEIRGVVHNLKNSYYLIDQDWIQYTLLELKPGVHLKFTSGHAFLYRYSISDQMLRMKGTADKPIIIEGYENKSGSWGGLFLGGRFDIEHVIIKNGGEYILENATERANIVSAYPSGGSGKPDWFKNNTVSNSAGYGIVMERSSYNFDFTNPDQANKFSNNSSGDIIDKRIQ